MTKLKIIILLMLLCFTSSFAISGYVHSNSGKPLSGTIVKWVNKGLVDTTDQNGYYSISLSGVRTQRLQINDAVSVQIIANEIRIRNAGDKKLSITVIDLNGRSRHLLENAIIKSGNGVYEIDHGSGQRSVKIVSVEIENEKKQYYLVKPFGMTGSKVDPRDDLFLGKVNGVDSVVAFSPGFIPYGQSTTNQDTVNFVLARAGSLDAAENINFNNPQVGQRSRYLAFQIPAYGPEVIFDDDTLILEMIGKSIDSLQFLERTTKTKDTVRYSMVIRGDYLRKTVGSLSSKLVGPFFANVGIMVGMHRDTSIAAIRFSGTPDSTIIAGRYSPGVTGIGVFEGITPNFTLFDSIFPAVRTNIFNGLVAADPEPGNVLFNADGLGIICATNYTRGFVVEGAGWFLILK